MAIQVGFGGAFTPAFAVTRHHPSLPDARFLFYDTPRYGSSIHALRGHAVKRDETSQLPFAKSDEITTHNAELQILSETVDNSDKYR